MMILNQSGTSLYNVNNLLCIKVSENYVKIQPDIPLRHENEEKIPQIIVAKYDSHEQAKSEFEKLIARIAYGNVNVYQMPEKGRKE